MRGMCTKLGSLREGRKSVILLSEGFNATLPPQMRSNLPGGMAGGSGVGGGTRDPFAGDNNTTGGSRAVLGRHGHAARAAGRLGRLQPQQHRDLRRRSARAGGRRASTSRRTSRCRRASRISTRRSTRCASWPTTPTAARSSTATIWPPGMKQIIRDSSAYYLVGYNSTQAPTDGKFHEIKVRVKRPGVQVSARQGYWALHRGRREARRRGTASPDRRRKSPRRWPRSRR